MYTIVLRVTVRSADNASHKEALHTALHPSASRDSAVVQPTERARRCHKARVVHPHFRSKSSLFLGMPRLLHVCCGVQGKSDQTPFYATSFFRPVYAYCLYSRCACFSPLLQQVYDNYFSLTESGSVVARQVPQGTVCGNTCENGVCTAESEDS